MLADRYVASTGPRNCRSLEYIYYYWKERKNRPLFHFVPAGVGSREFFRLLLFIYFDFYSVLFWDFFSELTPTHFVYVLFLITVPGQREKCPIFTAEMIAGRSSRSLRKVETVLLIFATYARHFTRTAVISNRFYKTLQPKPFQRDCFSLLSHEERLTRGLRLTALQKSNSVCTSFNAHISTLSVAKKKIPRFIDCYTTCTSRVNPTGRLLKKSDHQNRRLLYHCFRM